MRYILTLGILLIIGIKAYAHQDRYFTYKYNNVTVRFKTGSLYEEITNAKIIGQYSALLCEELQYKKPVLLDFVHDYGRSYKGENYSFVNIGTDVYNSVSYFTTVYDSTLKENVYQMVPYSKLKDQDQKGLEKMVYSTEPIDTLSKLVIRQFGFHFDVNHTLKLLYYAIKNPSEIINSSQIDTLYSYLPNMYYELNTIPKCKIDSIQALKIKDVENVVGHKIYAQDDTTDNSRLCFSYFAKDNSYLIYASINKKEIVLDTLSQIYSFKLNDDYWQSLFVFETPKSFKYYEQDGFDDDFKKSRLHEIPIEDESFVFFNVNWISDDIYFINVGDGIKMSPINIFPYLTKEDVFITDFEEYISSHRKD